MFRSFRRRPSAPPVPPARRPRLGLERFEDRLVPATFLVTNPSDNLLPGSLRYALTQANLPGNEGSTVEITPQLAGPINLTGGELPISSSMTIRNDSGAPLEIHQSTAGARVFHVGGGASAVTLTGVDAGGVITLYGGAGSGGNDGGILVDGAASTLTLSDVDLVGNSAAAASGEGGNGGGIYSAGRVVLDHSAVGTAAAPNTATGQGGGVWAGAGVTLTAGSVTGNRAGTDGGGILVGSGAVSLDGSSVDSNRAPNGMGGGIDVASGSVTVEDGSHVDDNSARDVGGILVGAVATTGADAVDVTGGSTVNDNSSTAVVSVAAGDFGGGGIAAVTTGNVTVSDSQVSDNHTVGMYSGGIVVGLGSVTVTDGSRIDGNTNNGPGGGIAANFRGVVTVTGGSQVDRNTGAGIGGGIVNFAGLNGGVVVTGGSQVDDNVLTNAETLPQAIGVFLQVLEAKGGVSRFASSVGGPGGSALLGELAQTAATAAPLVRQLEGAVQALPGGPAVTGGGIGTLLAPITVSGDSEIDGNVSGRRVAGGDPRSVGFGGGLFSMLGAVAVDQSTVDGNQARQGDGGGLYDALGFVDLLSATLDDNIALRDGGAVWSGGLLEATGTTVSNNNAGHDGGGLYNARGGLAVVIDSVFQGNNAGRHGGAVEDQGTYIAFDVSYADNTPENVSRRL